MTVGAEFDEDVRADFTARAVAAVEHHFDRAGQLEAAEDILLVRGDDVDARSRPRALGEGAFLKNGLDLLDFFAVNGGLSGHTLNPLYSGGLWLAVIMTPPCRLRCLTAK